MALFAKSLRADSLQGLVDGGCDLLCGNVGIGDNCLGNSFVKNAPTDSFLNKLRKIAVGETVPRKIAA